MATSQVKVSTANSSGKKGALCLRFQYEDTSFVFINCHLAGGVGKACAAERQQQIDQIVSVAFKGERGTQYQSYEVANHNVKVLFGDVNFRLNLNRAEV